MSQGQKNFQPEPVIYTTFNKMLLNGKLNKKKKLCVTQIKQSKKVKKSGPGPG